MPTTAMTNLAGWSREGAGTLEGNNGSGHLQGTRPHRNPFVLNQDFLGRWVPSILPRAASELHQEGLQQLKGLDMSRVSGIYLLLA